jgi:hypothetical protein
LPQPKDDARCPHSPAADRQECWEAYYGDVRDAGTIMARVGNPQDTEPWEWRCGFFPGSRPGECTGGTAETFDEARADFEAAWKVFLSNRTEADFQACAITKLGRLRSIAGSTATGCRLGKFRLRLARGAAG